MAKKKGKAALFNDDAFIIEEEQEVQEVQEDSANDVQEVHEDSTISTRSTRRIEFGATQGKKGHRAPRINMAFSHDNHEWIKVRSRQLGISATSFVNAVLEQGRVNGLGIISRQIDLGATQGKKGQKAPRINMAFSPDNYEWIKTRSRQLGLSATEFANAVLEQERLRGQR